MTEDAPYCDDPDCIACNVRRIMVAADKAVPVELPKDMGCAVFLFLAGQFAAEAADMSEHDIKLARQEGRNLYRRALTQTGETRH